MFCDLDCKSLTGQISDLKANADVSGIGVVASFVTVAFLTWLVLVLDYVFIFDPTIDPLSSSDDTNPHPNSVDVAVLNWCARVLPRPAYRWKGTVDKLILFLSDQQLLTGLAILISGFIQLSPDKLPIDSFHWQMLVVLVWYSSFTHLATLTIMRKFFREHRSLRVWRLVLMTFLMVGLIIALVPTRWSSWLNLGDNDNNYHTAMTVPACCFFKGDPFEGNLEIFFGGTFASGISGSVLAVFIISIVLLITSYSARAIKLFKSSSWFARRLLHKSIGSFVRDMLDLLYGIMGRGILLKAAIWIPYWYFTIYYIIVWAAFNLADSMLWEILWLSLTLVWGTLRLTTTREYVSVTVKAHKLTSDPLEDENIWAFGQCLPLLMLGAIPISAYEIITDELKENPPGCKTQDSSYEKSSSTNNIPLAEIFTGNKTVHRSKTAAAAGPMPLQNMTRSTTVVVTEENQIETPAQSLRANIATGSDEAFKTRGPGASHQRDFDQLYWFKLLKFMILVQMLFLSSNIVQLASGRAAVLDMVVKYIFWIVLYAPASLFLYVGVHLLPSVSSVLKHTRSWIWMVLMLAMSTSLYYKMPTQSLTESLFGGYF